MFCLMQQNITVYEVEELKISLETYVEQNNFIGVDFQYTEKIDFAGILLFLSLVKSCQERSLGLKLINLNDSILNNIKLCGANMILEKYYE